MEAFIQAFAATLLGETSIAELLAYFVLASIGAALYMAIRINARHKTDNGKPKKWSWRFFIKDNLGRMLITLILVFVWASHGHDLTGYLPSWASEIGKGMYIVIGFLTDLIVVYLKKGYLLARKKFNAILK